jgi:A/G-specific adenine glycosylase
MTTPLTSRAIAAFRKKIYDHYEQEGRDLPWRKRVTPYRVLVSEIMLQQTQVDRVIDKYRQFLEAFPDFPSLAAAPTPELLRIWSGLGYNRRALSLRKLAQVVVEQHEGKLPSDPEKLQQLPGIGPYTAGAVAAFAFNKPVIFLDTNVRRVYIHEFCKDRQGVHDDELRPLIEQTLPPGDSRTWYNALMDYGSMLKSKEANPNRRSAHYTRQSPFENSNRQVRGAILKTLVADSPLTAAQIMKRTDMDSVRIQENLVQLELEGFISKKGRNYFI